MTTANISYQATATSIAIAGSSALVDGGFFSSELVNNATNLYMDAIINGSIETGSSVTVDGQVNVFVVGSSDGTEFTGGVDAGAGTITWGTTGNTTVNSYLDMKLLGTVAIASATNNTDIPFGPFNIASAFGGVMPVKWAVVIENQSGGSFNASATNNHLEYTGIEYTAA